MGRFRPPGFFDATPPSEHQPGRLRGPPKRRSRGAARTRGLEPEFLGVAATVLPPSQANRVAYPSCPSFRIRSSAK
jgi:hypothetical protein